MSAIYLVSIGQVEAGILSAVDAALSETFGFEVRRMADMKIPGGIFDTERHQYNSELLLRALHQSRPPDAFRLLGITAVDLFIPMLSFVFGQAQLNGHVAIVSYARLRQEFYQLPGNRTLTMERIIKEAVHETGHTLGLTHCLNKSCPMTLSTAITFLDAKGPDLCSSCRIALTEQHQITGQKNNAKRLS